jgi:hypothetical protein
VKPQRLIVHITRVADGETRQVDYGVHPRTLSNGETFTKHNAEWLWEEGNYGCDCNRRLFFERVTNPGYDGYHECGDEAYEVRLEWRDEAPARRA